MSERFLFHAAVYLILKKDKQILLSRRFNAKWMNGMYTLPSGHIDGNETVETALARETKEEINIVIAPADLQVVHLMHRQSSDGLEYFDFFLEPAKYSGTIKNNEPGKCDHLDWFPLNNLPPNTVPYLNQVFTAIEAGKSFSNFGFTN